ncbi:hypothetical protein GDO78_019763 [Eleutherodactylus coqui]|uniref:Uncharacterized protein n=1 Tax=Eleutherodactylus coqui TaxID=57060 RepID=A0A8J6EBQ7_ELECQ|nr:hypothetical protein GDO78_019763 [Eleutherodactylus coqui]
MAGQPSDGLFITQTHPGSPPLKHTHPNADLASVPCPPDGLRTHRSALAACGLRTHVTSFRTMNSQMHCACSRSTSAAQAQSICNGRQRRQSASLVKEGEESLRKFRR